MHVLIVEDDELVGDGLKRGLEALGQTADWVTTAAAADSALAMVAFDVVVLDLGLPDSDGLSLLQRWRRQGIDVPVLVLTARDAVPERVQGLNAGADDYLTKPFDLEELAARLHSLTRRAGGRASNVMRYGSLVFDPVARSVSIAGKPVALSRRELAVLQALLSQPGRVFSAGQLQDHVYGWSDGVESNAVAVHVHNLRSKLGNNLIQTVRGLGYKLGEAAK